MLIISVGLRRGQLHGCLVFLFRQTQQPDNHIFEIGIKDFILKGDSAENFYDSMVIFLTKEKIRNSGSITTDGGDVVGK